MVSKDHIHLLVSAPPNIAENEIMSRVKVILSSKIFERFPYLKKRVFDQYLDFSS